MLRRSSAIGLLAMLAGVFSQPVAQASPAWVAVSSPHFVVNTNAGPESGRRAAFLLEQLRSVLPVPSGTGQIFLYRSPEEFRDRAPNSGSAGFLRSGGGTAFLVAGDPRSLLHEYVHWALESRTLPVWASEGLADFYAAVRTDGQRHGVGRDGDGRDGGEWLIFGEPIEGRLSDLRRIPLWPVEKVAAVTRSSPEYRDPDSRRMFYAQAWALAQLLTLHGRALETGGPDLDAELAGHVARGAVVADTQLIRRPMVDMDEARFAVTPLAPAEILTRRAAMEQDPGPLLAAAVDADPTFAPALEGLGDTALARHDSEAALGHYAAAIANGSQRADTYYLAGLIELHHRNNTPAAEPYLERAVALDPSRPAYRSALEWLRGESAERQAKHEASALIARSLAVHRPLAGIGTALLSAAGRRALQPPAASVTRNQWPWLFGPVRSMKCGPGPVCYYTR